MMKLLLNHSSYTRKKYSQKSKLSNFSYLFSSGCLKNAKIKFLIRFLMENVKNTILFRRLGKEFKNIFFELQSL